MSKLGVLFSDNLTSEHYHLMHNGIVTRDVLETDRRQQNSNHVYHTLFNAMSSLDVDRLWVYPDTQLSTWVLREDFKYIQGLKWFSPDAEHHHPTGIRIEDKRGLPRFVFFPEYGDFVRKHRDTDTWVLPRPSFLWNTIHYIEDSIEQRFLWGARHTSINLLRAIHRNSDIVPFRGGELWDSMYTKTLVRPIWSHRLRTGKKGLTDPQKKKKFVHGFDKNMQYLGACIGLSLPNGKYREVSGDMFHKDLIGLWEYELIDLNGSMFNSYECYCPLNKKYSWGGTSVIHAAMQSGMKINIKRGIIWQRPNIAGQCLETWARRIYRAREQLKNEGRYPDTIASKNAQDTVKKMYLDMIGSFCSEFSKEYFHRDWNTLIIQEAIARQMFTLLARQPLVEGNTVLVCNDSFFLLSDNENPYCDYGSLLTHAQELRGYRHIGVCQLDEELVTAFETENSPSRIEAIIKDKVKAYATIAV